MGSRGDSLRAQVLASALPMTIAAAALCFVWQYATQGRRREEDDGEEPGSPMSASPSGPQTPSTRGSLRRENSNTSSPQERMSPEESLRLRRAKEKEREEAELEFLASRVSDVSKGRFRLVDTPDRGRCLVAGQDMAAGTRVGDIPVIPHGSEQGLYLMRVVQPDIKEADRVSSADLLAGLDFLASLALALAGLAPHAELRALSSLYRFSGEGIPQVPMIRRWHARFRPELRQEVGMRAMEQAWARVEPNWRRLVSAVPRGSWVEDEQGEQRFILGWETVCGLWLMNALCEHHCDPNCTLLFDGDRLWFVVIRDIKEGEAVTTSYLSTQSLGSSKQVRRQELMETWGFVCQCERCQSQDSEDEAEEVGEEVGMAEEDHTPTFPGSPGAAMPPIRTPPARSAACSGQQTTPSSGSPCTPESPERTDAVVEFDWQTPPGDEEAERAKYCASLEEMAARFQNALAVRSQLLILQAFFEVEADDRRRKACVALEEVTTQLLGENSEAALRARCLLDDAPALFRKISAEALQKGSSDVRMSPLDMDEELAEIASSEEASRRALRGMCRVYLLSRAWPRRRIPDCHCYVAASPRRTKKHQTPSVSTLRHFLQISSPVASPDKAMTPRGGTSAAISPASTPGSSPPPLPVPRERTAGTPSPSRGTPSWPRGTSPEQPVSQ